MKIIYWVLIGFCFYSGLSWWEIGHMAVSKVAQDQLHALGETEAYDKFNLLIHAFDTLTDQKSNSFVQAAVWADDIKQYGVKMFDQYHFTNVIYDPHNLFKGMSDLQRDINSINTIGWCMNILKTNRDEITFERAFMARYLLHVVGDIHQPLHSVMMYNETYKNGDMGGNLIKVKTIKNENTNLHSFMDSMAGEQDLNERIERPLTQSGKEYIKGLAGEIRKQYPPQKFGEDLIGLADSHAWTIQSYKLAVSKIYPEVEKTSALDKEWTEEMFELCRERVALAGYRLANMIALIYKK